MVSEKNTLFQNPFKPRVLSDEEIEIIIGGERRAIDKHILFSLNRLADAHERTLNEFKNHQEKEDQMVEDVKRIGGMEAIAKRAEYVDSIIKRNNDRSAMMRKVSESSLNWALLAFFGFLAMSTWNEIVRVVKSGIEKLG